MEVRWRMRVKEDVTLNEVLACTPSLTHPLISRAAYYVQQTVVDNSSEEIVYEFADPLGATNDEDVTPRSARVDQDLHDNNVQLGRRSPALDNTLETKPVDRMVVDIDLPDFQPWRIKRENILNTFSTGENLSISSSFLPANTDKRPNLDKIKRRLEVLEDLSGLRKLSELSQNEFVLHVNELRELLIVAWNNNKRVEAVRLVTELARMLSSTANPSFYPNQWVLVTDILDLFGKLVYDRLEAKSNEERRLLGQQPLNINFSSDDVPPTATEVAKNWFCKIADIKELIPRLYVETSLIACMRFLDSSSLRVNLLRLSSMTSKFPHPLLTAYARAYVCKVSMCLEPTDRAPHWRALNDWMQSSLPTLPELTWPALEWIIQCVSHCATTIDDIGPLWGYCKQSDKRSFLVRAFLNGVSPRYLSSHALDVTEIVVAEGSSGTDIAIFGDRLLLTETPEAVRSQVLRSAWKTVARLPSVRDYLQCCITWSRFTSKYFSVNEIVVIAEHMIKRLSHEKNHESFLPSLVTFVQNIMENRSSDLSTLMQKDAVMILLDWLRDEPFAAQSARAVLSAFVKVYAQGSIDDYVFAMQISDLCGRLSTSLKPDTGNDEVRSACHLICSVLDRVSLSVDPDRGLTFLVAGRASLGNLQIVTQHIVALLIQFALKCSFSMRDSSKKANFMRACIANLFITIPSIENVNLQFNSALMTVYISIQANSLPQTDALMKFAVEILDGLPPSYSIVPLVAHWLAILVSVPDSPAKPILYLFNSLVHVIERKHWSEAAVLAELYALCLRYLWTISQAEIPGKFNSSQANDVIYGSSQHYHDAIQEKTTYVMDKMMELVSSEDSSKPYAAILLLEFVSARVEIEGPVCRLINNLMKICVRSGTYEKRVAGVILDLKLRSTESEDVDILLNKFSV